VWLKREKKQNWQNSILKKKELQIKIDFSNKKK